MEHCAYVLVTSARNEEEHIERAIESVVSQTVLPARWVIISDGSTDGTDEIIEKYSKKHDFIIYLRADGDVARNFGSKARAIRMGEMA